MNTHWTLMSGVSESPHKLVNRGQLLEEVIQGAPNTRLIDKREDIVSTWSFRAGYGYPTPGPHRDEVLAELIPSFEERCVYLRGRCGLWKYEVSNQDNSFTQGVEVVDRLVNGLPEITATDPNYANSKKHPWPFERWSATHGEAVR